MVGGGSSPLLRIPYRITQIHLSLALSLLVAVGVDIPKMMRGLGGTGGLRLDGTSNPPRSLARRPCQAQPSPSPGAIHRAAVFPSI